MSFKGPKYISYLFSISIHAIFIILLVLTNLSPGTPEEEYVLVGYGPGFGSGGKGGSGQTDQSDKNSPVAETPPEKKEKDKKVELPKAEPVKDDDQIASSDKNKKENNSDSKLKPLLKGNTKGDGFGYGGEGTGGGGGFGFELDFGGNGKRRIYSYSLPEYPEGVSKEIDLRLRFTILPDGTVSRIVPLIKADAQLEMAAINSLRQWRFEPLPQNAKQMEQTVVITFPYRLQ